MKNKKIISIIFVYIMLFALIIISVSAAQLPVDLGTADNFAILAKSGISTTGTTSITGNIGVSPIDSTAITGFGLIMDSSNEFSTSSIVTGKIYAADYTMPTPTIMTTVISDMEIAYNDASGRTNPTATELGAGDISGKTITPGLYKWGTGVLINNDITISGKENDVWIFQIAQDLTIGNGVIITLSGGAQAKNIFWQVGGTTKLGTTSNFKGIILSKTAIVLNTGATLKGRALAQTAVTLDASIVTEPRKLITTTTDSNTDDKKTNTQTTNSNTVTVRTNNQTRINPNTTTIKTNNQITTTNNVKVETSEKVEPKENIIVKTRLNTRLNNNESLGSGLKYYLSNGKFAYVKIFPSQASAQAQEVLRAKCEEKNCTIELKEAKINGEKKAVYEVNTEKKSKIFGFIKKQMKVRAFVDAETGKVIDVNKPWWSFLAKEEDV